MFFSSFFTHTFLIRPVVEERVGGILDAPSQEVGTPETTSKPASSPATPAKRASKNSAITTQTLAKAEEEFIETRPLIHPLKRKRARRKMKRAQIRMEALNETYQKLLAVKDVFFG